MVLGLLLLAPASARAQDGGDGDEEEEEAEDASTQSGPPKMLLDPRRAPVERRGGAKLAQDPGDEAEDKEAKKKEADDEDGEEDAADKGLAGQDEPVPGGGDGQWSTSTSADRKEVVRPPRDTKVNIDFVDTDLKDVVKYFAEITGRNFVIAEKLSGKVTIISPTPVTVAEAYEAFMSALDAAGFATVTEGKVIRIVPNRQSIKEPIRTYAEGYLPYTANMVTRIIQLQNMSAEDLSKIASKMVGDGGDVTAYTPTNALIITDSANNIRRIEELLRLLDVSAPVQKLEVIQLEWADATEMVEKIKTVFGVDEADAGGAATQQRESSRRTSKRDRRSKRDKKAETKPKGASSDKVGSESYIGKIMADERTNSIIIMATDQALEDVKEFIREIDYEVDIQGDIHVVYLEHAKAEDLAQVLTNLTQETNQRAQQNQRRGGRTGGTQAAGGDKKGGASGGSGGSTAQFEGGVKVTADIATNSLVVTASRDDFLRLKRVIDMLDIRRKQVFVEAVIMEITDNMERDTGVGFHTGYAKESLGKSGLGAGGIGSVGGGSLMQAFSGDAGLALDLSGLALGLFGSSIPVAIGGTAFDIPAFGVVITALQSDTNTEVLSAPNLLTLDNEEAEIIVGQTIPFSAGFTTTTQGLPIANFSREDVALTLRITPQINESDMVTLQVFQEITEVVPETQGTDLLSSGGVTTTKRSVETVVNVRNNQTIVLGGLMQTNQILNEDKVPLLGDIPLFGALFRSKKKVDKKTNLLLFLTPHVIDTPEDLQEVYMIKMLQKEEFMRRFYGKSLGEQQAELNDLLRYSMNLPDIPSVYRERQSEPRYDSTELEELYRRRPGPSSHHGDPVFRPADGDDDDEYEDEYEYDDEEYDEGYDEGYEDGEYDTEEDFLEEEEEEEEEEAGSGGTPFSGDYAPQPGEILIHPDGGEVRYPAPEAD